MKFHQYRQSKIAEIQSSDAEPIRLQGGPTLWLAGPKVLETCGQEVGRLGQNVLLTGEEWLLARFRKRLIQGLIQEGLPVSLAPFPANGECCEENVQALMDKAKEQKAEVIAALGGGKCLDTAKLAASRLKLPLVTIPSSAATCACASTIVAFYTEEGEYLEVVDLPKAADLCLVDFELLKTAPPKLLSAGMADTLAKWLELEPLVKDGNHDFGQSAGILLAKQAHEIIINFGAEALSGSDAAWTAAVEANLYQSALASCLGGGMALAAHSFCNGLSIVPELKTWLHGELVGVGLLFQERLLKSEVGSPKSESRLEQTLKSLRLPVRLPKLPEDMVGKVCDKMVAQGETIHLIPETDRLNPENLRSLLLSLVV
jgi:glycerol dehydrogenase